MSFQKLSKGSILYIEALDPYSIDTATNTFSYKGATITAPGNKYIAATATTNGLSNSTAAQVRFRRVTEHNRAPLSFNNIRIENSQRMANGTLRKYFIADKLSISVSWDMLPSFRNETVDGGWGAEDLKNFYESAAGRMPFRIKINPTVFDPALVEQSDGTLADDYTYLVMFTAADFTIEKRGLQTYWSVNLSMEQV
jgi:hypothetical protein